MVVLRSRTPLPTRGTFLLIRRCAPPRLQLQLRASISIAAAAAMSRGAATNDHGAFGPGADGLGAAADGPGAAADSPDAAADGVNERRVRARVGEASDEASDSYDEASDMTTWPLERVWAAIRADVAAAGVTSESEARDVAVRRAQQAWPYGLTMAQQRRAVELGIAEYYRILEDAAPAAAAAAAGPAGAAGATSAAAAPSPAPSGSNGGSDASPSPEHQPILDVVISGAVVRVMDRGALKANALVRMTAADEVGAAARGPPSVRVSHLDGRVTEFPAAPVANHEWRSSAQQVDDSMASYQDWWAHRVGWGGQ